jgi:hypothetical protein
MTDRGVASRVGHRDPSAQTEPSGDDTVRVDPVGTPTGPPEPLERSGDIVEGVGEGHDALASPSAPGGEGDDIDVPGRKERAHVQDVRGIEVGSR